MFACCHFSPPIIQSIKGKVINMSKEELKSAYKMHKITAKEYFLKLSKIISTESPKDCIVRNSELMNLIDGKLPVFNH